jgi:low density lipoprotein-related protein 2
VVIDTDGNWKRDLLDEKNSISLPKALAVYDKRLYYLDPRFERLERVDIATGDNAKTMMDNEPDLKTFTIFRKRPRECIVLVWIVYGMF